MDQRSPYDDFFFDDITATSMESARVVVPVLMDVVEPRSVVDVGCGRGTWLRVFHDCGVSTIQGYDGDYVSRSELLIPEPSFQACDLTKPLTNRHTFDLAVCLEVGEHLPDSRATGLVRDLTRLSSVVLFSAAVPGQGGSGHINERWPDYWIDRFLSHGYEPIECLRPRFVSQSKVAWWFRQNMMLFVDPIAFETHPKLAAEREACRERTWDWVHARVVRREQTLRSLLKDLPRAAVRALQHRSAFWR